MRPLPLLLAAALAGCASASQSPEPESVPTPATTRIGVGYGDAVSLAAVNRGNSIAKTLAVPIEKAWPALPAAFEALSLPIGFTDPPSFAVGNEGFKVRRQLGGEYLSRYLDCGSMQGGPSADSYEIMLGVVTRLKRDEASGGTVVSTSVEARGRPVAITGDWVRCTSRGLLEERIVVSLRRQTQP